MNLKSGVVQCKCGGIIISNSGKVRITFDTAGNNDDPKLLCDSCFRKYKPDYIYDIRRENELVRANYIDFRNL